MIHALIIGPRGVGKSTLIRRVIQELSCPVFGFETKREPEMYDEELGDPIYIHEIGEPWYYAKDNLMGYCKNCRFNTLAGGFDSYAPKLMQSVPDGGVICFDELGFMEAREAQFCKAVLSKLDENTPVIAAVKDKDFPFLNEVRAHPNCRCFYLTEENRNELYLAVLTFVQASLAMNEHQKRSKTHGS